MGAKILLADLRKQDSVIERVVAMRNAATHEQHIADDVKDVLQALRRLMERVAE